MYQLTVRGMEELDDVNSSGNPTVVKNHIYRDTELDQTKREILGGASGPNDVNVISQSLSSNTCIVKEVHLIYSSAETPANTDHVSELPELVLDATHEKGTTVTDLPSSGLTDGTKVVVIEASIENQENSFMTDEAILYAIANGIADNTEMNKKVEFSTDVTSEQKTKTKKSKRMKGKKIQNLKNEEREDKNLEKLKFVECNANQNLNIKSNINGYENKKSTKYDDTNKGSKISEAQTFCCDKCNKVFQEYKSLTDHLIIHVDARPTCGICGKHYKSSHRLRNHMRSHYGNKKPFKCDEPQCGKSFQKKQYLIVHRRVHTKEKPYKCSHCPKTFSHAVTLQRHSRVHSGEKPYSCPKCGKCFAVLGQYCTHLRIHTGEKRYQCPKCDKQFIASGQLTVHMRTHTGEKPFKCDICTQTFSHSSTLKTHKRKHSGEKPYSCTLCSNKFTTHGQLTNHFRTHTGEKPFSCDICGKEFIQSGNLKAHKKLHFDENSKRYFIKEPLREKSSQTSFDATNDR